VSYVSLPDPILTIQDVVRVTTVSRGQIYRLLTRNEFPPPVHLSAHRIGWRQSVVESWLASRGCRPLRDKTGEGN
jgi:prophage regulatory protein